MDQLVDLNGVREQSTVASNGKHLPTNTIQHQAAMSSTHEQSSVLVIWQRRYYFTTDQEIVRARTTPTSTPSDMPTKNLNSVDTDRVASSTTMLPLYVSDTWRNTCAGVLSSVMESARWESHAVPSAIHRDNNDH